MKYKIVLIITLFFTAFSYGQVQWGVKGGLNLATVRYLETENSKARLGWNTGALLEIPVQSNLYVRPEVLYSSKGFGFKPTETSMAGSVRLNYISVPLLLEYNLRKGVEIMAGPELGFLQKAVAKSQGITNDMTNFYRHFDVGVDLGIAYSVNKFFGVEARYNYGFKDLVNVVYLNDNGDVVAQGKNGANSVLQVGVFYWLSQ